MISLGALALAAAMAYTSDPVQVTTCSLEEIFIPVTSGDIELQQAAGSQLHIGFTNVSTTPIASVTFDVNLNGTDRTIVDAGTFSQGVLISHYFAQSDLVGGNASCHVASVLFKDGSAWM
jgi:hypothetical protein